MNRPLLLALMLSLTTPPAMAADISWSGFGTIGYARSDQPYAYERFTDNQGTFKRDSIFGLQAVAGINHQWSATLQATLAPSASDDRQWGATLPWAFVSYRPSNDLLLRFGKLRIPMYLYSENMNVGASYTLIHLPTEVYSTSPTTNYSGASFSKTWTLETGDLSLDGYAGRTKTAFRLSATQQFVPFHAQSAGLVLNLRHEEDIYRAGLLRAHIETPGSSSLREFNTNVFLLGADIGVSRDFRLIGEYARRYSIGMITYSNSQGAYLSLLRKIGPWTPYITAARLLSDKSGRQSSPIYEDQWSSALGMSYSLSSTSKIKGEWMRTHIGGGSTLVDAPAGINSVSHLDINIVSLSYNFSF